MLQLLSKISRCAFSNKISIDSIPSLKEFNSKANSIETDINDGKADSIFNQTNIKKSNVSFHIETYGCQMNVNDSQIVRSLLLQQFQQKSKDQADIILLNTCAIRQAAEEKIYHRINQYKRNKIVGVLGCMAERVKDKMFQHGVHVVCGPDAYRDLPRLIGLALESNNGINVQLSAEETYAQVIPVRKNPNNVSAFISIMRGCNNMCSFCIVPFVRGRQRSRTLETILKEIEVLDKQGVKQITFLGQNVNSYHDTSVEFNSSHINSEGFSQMFKMRNLPGYRFANLLQHSAKAFPNIRFRFTSPHPKDFPDQLLRVIAENHNICNYIHLPAQSGNTQMLFKMRRNHTRESYLNLVDKIRSIIKGVSLSTDLMCGFCGETDEQFQDTMSLIRTVKFDMAFLFAYSMREKTHAHRNFTDDISPQVKKQRLIKMIEEFNFYQGEVNKSQLNKIHTLLIEQRSKRDPMKFMGKTDTFKKGYIRQCELPVVRDNQIVDSRTYKKGDFVLVRVNQTGPRALQCQPLAILQNLKDSTKQNQILQLLQNRKSNYI